MTLPSSVRNVASAAAWLDRIVVNECRDRLRRRRIARTVIDPRSESPDRPGPVVVDAGTEERAALREAL
jgi:DNA-directed RNA polymerase specialized sigma24 family protein